MTQAFTDISARIAAAKSAKATDLLNRDTLKAKLQSLPADFTDAEIATLTADEVAQLTAMVDA